MIRFRAFVPALVSVQLCVYLSAQGRIGAISGQVRDKTKNPISGATLTFQLPGGGSRTVKSNKAGMYEVHGLTTGSYSVRAEAKGFDSVELRSVRLTGSRRLHLNFTLDLPPVKQVIVVSSGEKPLSIEPESGASTIQLQGAALTGLPDDPNDFAAAVQALAGPSALGPTVAQLFVNGFLLSEMPPKQTIREIRINDNPFSAENDRPATNRIEAVTKSGGQRVHGQAYGNLDLGWWDARNPFSSPLPPNPSRLFGGNVSGPISSRATYFVSLERTQLDFKNAVNATILNASLAPTLFVKNVADFERRLTFSPQVDFTLNKANTLMARYSSSSYSLPGEGVGGPSLPDTGYSTSQRQQTAQITETAVLSPKSVDETKFQFLRTSLTLTPSSLAPAIAVDQAFTSGSSPSTLNTLKQSQWEFQNNVSSVHRHHAVRAGVRLRGDVSSEILETNVLGKFSFSSGLGPELGPNSVPVLDANGTALTVPLSALERYRRTILFKNEGFSPSEIRLLGGGASSFSIDGGNPRAQVRQYDAGLYLQDDWHVRPNLLLGAGIRYEAQTDLHGHGDVGPRLSFAWSPSKRAKDNPHTILRGGLGLFYERLDSTLVLQTRHSQEPHVHYTTSEPSLLDSFPAAPSMESLALFAIRADTLALGRNVQAPATLQATLGIEQELPYKTRLAATYTGAETFRDLLLVDSTPFQQGSPRDVLIESLGRLTERQLKLEVSNTLSKRVALTASYVLNHATSDTDGTKYPAASPDDLQDEFGRSAKDLRNNLTLTGSLDAPWGLRLSPFIVASSGRPFNIVTGRYQDTDIPLTERPALAVDPSEPGVIFTRFGTFLLNPLPGESVIARNYAQGPPFFSLSFRLSKTFTFGEAAGSKAKAQSKGEATNSEQRYSLVASAQVINLTNHLNPGILEGNLSAPTFGQASSMAPGFNFGGGAAVFEKQPESNRRIEVQLRFTF